MLDFIEFFVKVMSELGYVVDGDTSCLCFNHKGVEIVLFPPFDVIEDYEECYGPTNDDFYVIEHLYEDWVEDSNGNWIFYLRSSNPKESNLDVVLEFKQNKTDMESFVRKVIDYVEKAEYYELPEIKEDVCSKDVQMVYDKDDDLPF